MSQNRAGFNGKNAPNLISAGAAPQTPLGSLKCFPKPPDKWGTERKLEIKSLLLRLLAQNDSSGPRSSFEQHITTYRLVTVVPAELLDRLRRRRCPFVQ